MVVKALISAIQRYEEIQRASSFVQLKEENNNKNNGSTLDDTTIAADILINQITFARCYRI